ncbi:hypothetical protein ACG02S_16700 [Roseateles sp. DC23W]|uniref:DUF3304 domain-containing protein n=1 Tax=Pelomonas dachongensis TaxID=3299029 RepID=A0ABW7EQ15_9BURK
MTIRSLFSTLRNSIWILLISVVAGCASSPSQVAQGFSCDMWYDGWGEKVALLEYSYGDEIPSLHKKSQNETGLGCAGLVWSPMPTASFLYVKWRIRSTNEIVEERVDLRGRLPYNMKDHEVTFVLDGRQLYVYLVTPKKITTNLPQAPLRTWRSRHQVTYEIYPNNDLKTQERK